MVVEENLSTARCFPTCSSQWMGTHSQFHRRGGRLCDGLFSQCSVLGVDVSTNGAGAYDISARTGAGTSRNVTRPPSSDIRQSTNGCRRLLNSPARRGARRIFLPTTVVVVQLSQRHRRRQHQYNYYCCACTQYCQVSRYSNVSIHSRSSPWVYPPVVDYTSRVYYQCGGV